MRAGHDLKRKPEVIHFTQSDCRTGNVRIFFVHGAPLQFESGVTRITVHARYDGGLGWMRGRGLTHPCASQMSGRF